jgi:uncharacterized membrane protein YeaQ/YmgE (transglycosylase-associated protein family)
MSAITWSEHCGRAIPDSLGLKMYPQDNRLLVSRQKRNRFGQFLCFFAVSRSRTSQRKQSANKTETKPMNIISLIIQAISGAVGGNVAGAAMKENSLGTLGNSIAGIVGGGLGGTILQMVMGTAAAGGGGLDLQSILANVGRRRGRRHPYGHHRHHQEQDGGKVAR